MTWIKFRLLKYIVEKFATTKSRKRLRPNMVGLKLFYQGLTECTECVRVKRAVEHVCADFISLISSLVVVEKIKLIGLRFNTDQ